MVSGDLDEPRVYLLQGGYDLSERGEAGDLESMKGWRLSGDQGLYDATSRKQGNGYK